MKLAMPSPVSEKLQEFIPLALQIIQGMPGAQTHWLDAGTKLGTKGPRAVGSCHFWHYIIVIIPVCSGWTHTFDHFG